MEKVKELLRIEEGVDFLYGYVNDEQFVIENDVKQICAFIMEHQFENVLITNVLDIPILETRMGFIDYCANQEFLIKELIPMLAPMQMGEVEPPEFVPYEIE